MAKKVSITSELAMVLGPSVDKSINSIRGKLTQVSKNVPVTFEADFTKLNKEIDRYTKKNKRVPISLYISKGGFDDVKKRLEKFVGKVKIVPTITQADIKASLTKATQNIKQVINANIKPNIPYLRAELLKAKNLKVYASVIPDVNKIQQTLDKKTYSIRVRTNIDRSSIQRGVSGGGSKTLDFSSTRKQVVNLKSDMQKLGEETAETFRRFGLLNVAFRTLNSLTGAFRESFTEALAFEQEILKISQVTGSSLASLKNLTQEITSLSTGLGTSSKNLADASQILAQAGLSANDTKDALESLALTTLSPTFDDITDTTEAAIAAMSQFGLKAKDLEGVLGSINSVSAKFAVESSDLAIAIRRTGGAFEASGGSLNELLALFTSVRSTTRESAESIATGFRTIFTRLQRARTQDFLKTLNIDLKTSANEAKEFGKTEGEFIGPYKAIERLSKALSSISSNDPRYSQIIEELGGFRQISKVIPLIQKFSVSQQALAVAMQGTGSLSKDAAIAQKGLANQIQKVREEFNAFVRDLTGSDAFKQITKVVIDLSRAIIDVATNLKDVAPLFLSLGVVAARRPATDFLKGFGSKFDRPIRRSRGGGVPGSGSGDKVHAMLEPGEFVLNKRASRKLGRSKLEDLNSGNVQMFSEGGFVEKLQGVQASKASEQERLKRLTREQLTIEGYVKNASEQRLKDLKRFNSAKAKREALELKLSRDIEKERELQQESKVSSGANKANAPLIKALQSRFLETNRALQDIKGKEQDSKDRLAKSEAGLNKVVKDLSNNVKAQKGSRTRISNLSNQEVDLQRAINVEQRKNQKEESRKRREEARGSASSTQLPSFEKFKSSTTIEREIRSKAERESYLAASAAQTNASIDERNRKKQRDKAIERKLQGQQSSATERIQRFLDNGDPDVTPKRSLLSRVNVGTFSGAFGGAFNKINSSNKPPKYNSANLSDDNPFRTQSKGIRSQIDFTQLYLLSTVAGSLTKSLGSLGDTVQKTINNLASFGLNVAAFKGISNEILINPKNRALDQRAQGLSFEKDKLEKLRSDRSSNSRFLTSNSQTIASNKTELASLLAKKNTKGVTLTSDERGQLSSLRKSVGTASRIQRKEVLQGKEINALKDKIALEEKEQAIIAKGIDRLQLFSDVLSVLSSSALAVGAYFDQLANEEKKKLLLGGGNKDTFINQRTNAGRFNIGATGALTAGIFGAQIGSKIGLIGGPAGAGIGGLIGGIGGAAVGGIGGALIGGGSANKQANSEVARIDFQKSVNSNASFVQGIASKNIDVKKNALKFQNIIREYNKILETSTDVDLRTDAKSALDNSAVALGVFIDEIKSTSKDINEFQRALGKTGDVTSDMLITFANLTNQYLPDYIEKLGDSIVDQEKMNEKIRDATDSLTAYENQIKAITALSTGFDYVTKTFIDGADTISSYLMGL